MHSKAKDVRVSLNLKQKKLFLLSQYYVAITKRVSEWVSERMSECKNGYDMWSLLGILTCL